MEKSGQDLNNRGMGNKMRMSFGIMLALLLSLAALAFLSFQRLEEAEAWDDHTYRVLIAVQEMQLDLSNMQSGLRGFALTGNPRFLEPFDKGYGSFFPHFEKTQRLTADNPEQQKRLIQVEREAKRWLKMYESVIALRDSNSVQSRAELNRLASVGAVPRKRIMDGLRATLGAMEQEEWDLLRTRSDNKTRLAAQTQTTLVAGNLFAALLMLVLFSLLGRSSLRLAATNEELQKEVAERHLAENKLQQAHDDLDLRVRERTAQLAHSNEALQREITQHQRTESEQKRASESLRESEERKAAILETALDAIISMDHQGRVIEFNPAAERIFGYEREQTIGREMSELVIPPHLRQGHTAGIARYLTTGKSQILGQRLEVMAMRADGSEFPCELTITSIERPGAPLFTGYLRDITERKQTEAKLQQAKEEAERANVAKSEFLSRMSHELRTPLNAILGFGQLLEMDNLTDKQRQRVEFMLNGGRHLLDLINEVLDIARIETGRLDVSIEPLFVGGVLSEALSLIQPTADSSGIKLGPFFLPEACVVPVNADRQRLKQVMLNLLSNAVKYNRPGGEVRVSCESRDEHLLIHVSDTGEGIAAEKIMRLFTPFDRLDAEQRGIDGVGIGLTLSKWLVELMKGTLTVASEPGVGTTFSVALPLAQHASNERHEANGRQTAVSETN